MKNVTFCTKVEFLVTFDESEKIKESPKSSTFTAPVLNFESYKGKSFPGRKSET